jgi:hypothetical protein
MVVLQVPAVLLLLVLPLLLLLCKVPLSCRREARRAIQVPAAPFKRAHHASNNL